MDVELLGGAWYAADSVLRVMYENMEAAGEEVRCAVAQSRVLLSDVGARVVLMLLVLLLQLLLCVIRAGPPCEIVSVGACLW